MFDLVYRRNPVEYAARQAAAAEARASVSNGPDRIELLLVGKINRAKVDALIAKLDAEPDARSVDLVIDSEGGALVAAYDFFVSLHNHAAERKVATILRAESGALLAALACDHRIALYNAAITIHPTRQSVTSDTLTAARAREIADNLAWTDRQIVGIIAYCTGADASLIAAEQETEHAASIAWCLTHNIIHEVWPWS